MVDLDETYRDPTPMRKFSDDEINLGILTSIAEELATALLTKQRGKATRRALALTVALMDNRVLKVERGIVKLSQTWNDTVNNIDRETKAEVDRLVDMINSTISSVTSDSEVINARISIDGTVHKVLKERLDLMEMNNIQYVVSNRTFVANQIIEITDLTEKSTDMSYEVIRDMPDVDDSQLAYQSLRTSDIAIERQVAE